MQSGRVISAALFLGIISALIVGLLLLRPSGEESSPTTIAAQVPATATPTRPAPRQPPPPAVLTMTVWPTALPITPQPTPVPLASGKLDNIEYVAFRGPDGQIAVRWQSNYRTRPELEQYVATNQNLLQQFTGDPASIIPVRIMLKQ